jgi:copper resistance protein D
MDALSIAQTGVGAVADIAFACTLGAALMNFWLSREQAFAPISPARRGWARAYGMGIGGALVMVLAQLVMAWLQAASMSGMPVMQAGTALWMVVTGSHAGIGLSIALAGGVLLVLASASGQAMSARRFAMVVVGALVAAAGKASIGHAADAGAFSLAEIIHTVHLLATATWGGLVIAGSLAVLPALGGTLARAFLIRLTGKMSTASVVALALVILTGLFNAWRGLGGSAGVLEESEWGQVLVVKAVLVAVVLIFGALNRWSALPRLRRTASTLDARTVTGVMRVEGFLMIAVFVAAAVLSHSVPGSAFAG